MTGVLAAFVLFGSIAVASAQAQQYVISTIVGGAPPAPLTATAATKISIGAPNAVAADSRGNVYFVSNDLNSVFKLDQGGLLTRVAGYSTAGFSGDGGAATNARLNLSVQGSVGAAVAADIAGNLFIADAGNNRIRKVSPDGIIDTVAGTGDQDFYGDGGPAVDAALYFPTGVAVDGAGNLFIADTGNQRIRKVSTSGIITTVAGNGARGFSGDGGPASAAALSGPSGVAVDGAGNVFIADTGNHSVRKVSANGMITTGAALSNPTSVAVDSAGNVFIADPQALCIRKLSAGGILTTVAGNGSIGYSGDGGPATGAQLSNPWGAAVDAAGNLFIADRTNTRIRKVSLSGIITTVAGDGMFDSPFSSAGDGGPAINAQLKLAVGLVPAAGLAVDREGNLFIADTGNHRIRKVSANGIITTIAGIGRRPCSSPTDCIPLGDGGPATSAALFYPTGVAVDSNGNLFIADAGNVRVRKVSPDGVITTVAPFSGGIAVDGAGNLFVAAFTVRKVSPDGTITTVAGGAGCDDDGCPPLGDGGPAVGARLGATAVAVDEAGSLFIADTQATDLFSDSRVRKVSGDGIITTLAGGAYGYSGDGGPAIGAQLRYVSGLAADETGNVFIADIYNQRIRQVSADGIITTVAGGSYRDPGEGGPAADTALNYPMAVAVDGTGNVYVADAGNNAIRVLRPTNQSASDAAGQTRGSDFSRLVVTYRLAWIAFWVQIQANIAGEFACGDDARGFVTVESKQPALVARHQIIGLARFGQSQQKVVGGVG